MALQGFEDPPKREKQRNKWNSGQRPQEGLCRNFTRVPDRKPKFAGN
jgi:hypothetical protein